MIAGTPEWQALRAHARQWSGMHLRELFDTDPERAGRFSLEAPGLFIDYSKQRVTTQTLSLLEALASRAGVTGLREDMFRGQRINATEGRAVLHTALRCPAAQQLPLDGRDVVADVHAVLQRMGRFAEAVRTGQWRGWTGQPVRDVVNIGIGGSHLGPQLACEALQPFGQAGLRTHFVANVDATGLSRVLAELDPARTLFIIASKTFSTQETMANARSARDWFVRSTGERGAIARHFAAVSTNLEATREFGIDPANVFEFWDWVGGRYSLWSAVGLPVMVAIGAAGFGQLLTGAHAMDRHFRDSPWHANAPMLLGMLGLWCNDFLHAHSQAVVPYDEHLALLPAYLQQLDMESNGKRVRKDGEPVDCETGPVVWGATGTNGQHAFFQLLHQGTRLVPVDFIAALHPHFALPPHQDLLLANCFAQSEALMRGRRPDEARRELEAAGLSGEALEALLPHRCFPGNRPSTTLLLERLTPYSLGALLALYEHRVFVQGAVWGVNSFDQWGVELGKQLAGRVLEDFSAAGTAADAHDASTAQLIARYREARGKG